MKKFTFLLSILFLACSLNAQRYLTEIFDDSEILMEEEVLYGTNASVFPVSEFLVRLPLLMDIYHPSEPAGSIRPVAIIIHNGTFLPPTFNGGCVGTRKDADVVEFARRFARMGYVACTIDYRLGWDPTSIDPDVVTNTMINAIYRGVQDLNTAIKFLKKTVAEDNNPYGVSDNQIMAMGLQTGAYVAYGAATLDNVTDTWIPKFITPAGPMVVESINGDVDANTVGIVPANFPFLPEGDTLCYPNHVGYDADFQLAVSLGGIIGDTSWITPNDVPMISAHVTTDPISPYGKGVIDLPPPLIFPFIEFVGGGIAIPKAVATGVNDPFDQPWIDPMSVYVKNINGGGNGLYPMLSTDPTLSSPWSFSYNSEPYGIPGSDCPTDQASATIFMDSIITYVAPRACLTLGLGRCFLVFDVLVNDINERFDFAI